MRAHVSRGELRGLVGLRVQPSERFQILQVLVLGKRGGQIHLRVVAPLRRHHHASNLLHLRVVRRADAVHVPRDLRPQIRDGDELLEHVFRQDVRVPRLLDVVQLDVNVVDAEVQIRRADGANAPVRLASESRLFAQGGSGDDELVAVGRWWFSSSPQ